MHFFSYLLILTPATFFSGFAPGYTGNILRIERNKSQTSYFYQSFAKTEDETEGGQGPTSPPGGAAQPLAVPTSGEIAWSTS
jgi:hypothetical protein